MGFDQFRSSLWTEIGQSILNCYLFKQAFIKSTYCNDQNQVIFAFCIVYIGIEWVLTNFGPGQLQEQKVASV